MQLHYFMDKLIIQSMEEHMSLENAIRMLAGTLVIIGVALTYFVNQYWLLLPLFVGANLFQSALTGFCPAEKVLRKLGVGAECDGCGPAHRAPIANR
jgi:hypothetical protein